MTSRQRMLAAIHHDKVDRVPVSPWHLGRIPWDSPLGREIVARCDPWLETGMGGDAYLGAAAVVESGDDGPRHWRTIHAPGRDLHAVSTTTAQTTAATEYACKTKADIEALLAIPYTAPRLVPENLRQMEAKAGEDALVSIGIGTALCFPNDYLGTEYCSLLWASEPQVIKDMVALMGQRVYDYVERVCQAGGRVFRLVGGEYATQLMGPRAWDELVVPFDKPLVDLIHRYGGIAHYHNHGNMQRFINKIAELGIDSLDPIEQPPYGDITMAEAQKRIGDRVCLVGGLDDMEVLDTRPLPEVLRLAEELLASVEPLGYMLGGTSSGIFHEQAGRAFIALVDVAERMAR
ncbi:MAG: uroporphyrinogen decarboxylase family protein [Anaerolineae bacterium]